MKTSTLAWLMLAVNTVGLLLLAVAFFVWSRLEHGMQTNREGLIEFLSLLIAGAFIVGLSQAWFAIFSEWTGRVLPANLRAGSRAGLVFGSLGFLSAIGVVCGVLLAGTDYSQAMFATSALATGLVVLSVLLVLEVLWVLGFAKRSSAAEVASV